MARVSPHGGGCCGARHIHGFATDIGEADALEGLCRQVPIGRMTEVILNGTQVNDKPRTMMKLAELGFVLDGHWINNNHGSHNYRFTRCDRRLPLDLPLWPGMVITPGTQGDLPFLRPDGNDLPPLPLTRVPEAQRIWIPRVGDIVQVNSPRSARHGQEATVRIDFPAHAGYDYPVSMTSLTGEDFSIVRRNVVLVRELVRAPRDIPLPLPIVGQIGIGDDVVFIRNPGYYRNPRRESARPQGTRGTVTRQDSIRGWFIRWDGENAPDAISTSPFCLFRVRANPNPHEDGRPHRHEQPDLARLVPEPPAPTIVFNTYHCVSRDGTRGAGYDTEDEAAQHLGRRTRIDRREIFSDGTTVWATVRPA